jgi:putative transposase
MKRGRFTEEQIIEVLREQEAGMKVTELCPKHGISEPTFYTWKAKFGGMSVSDAKRLKQLEDENSKLKKVLAEAAGGSDAGQRCVESKRCRADALRPSNWGLRTLKR